jgi:hypothetical protein
MIPTQESNHALPHCDWIYFATPSRASWTVTAEFVSEARMIIRTIHNSQGLRIANVARLCPGDTILLAYGGGGQPYRPLFRCTVVASPTPVQTSRHTFDVFSIIDGSVAERLAASGYEVDPVLNKHTGVTIAETQDLRQIPFEFRKPAGNNTLRRWSEVFR